MQDTWFTTEQSQQSQMTVWFPWGKVPRAGKQTTSEHYWEAINGSRHNGQRFEYLVVDA